MAISKKPRAPNEELAVALTRARIHGKPSYVVAGEARVDPPLLSKWAAGRRRPSRAQAERVSAVLGVPVEDIFPDLAGVNEALLAALARQREIGLYDYEIASQAGVSPSYLSDWLNGRKQPTPDEAFRLAWVLGESSEHLFPAVPKR